MSNFSLSRRLTATFGVCSLALLVASTLQYLPVYAAVPTVQNTLSIAKTGSEPFDATTWKSTQAAFPDGTTIDNGSATPNTQAGRDASEDNDVVRLGDTVTYRLEVAVNDAPVSDLVSTVVLGDGLDVSQEWVALPTGCKTDPNEVNIVSALQDTNGDGVFETLLCNTGPEIEGTNRLVFPVARVTRLTSLSQDPVLNDDFVAATVTSQATGIDGVSQAVQSGPVYANVTADFRVNLTKEISGASTNEQGFPVYPPKRAATGPAGEPGSLVTYEIKGRYENGSMVADDTNGNGTANYSLTDFYTDDNNNNNGAAPSTNGTSFDTNSAALSAGDIILYDFGPEGAAGGCSLIGDHGPSASVACSPVAAAADNTGPAYTPDGVNDNAYDINLSNVDVADPDGDGNLFAVRFVLFVPNSEITSHQDGAPFSSQFINEVQGAGVVPFAPQSQVYNQAGDRLSNYGTSAEPGNSTDVSAGSTSDNVATWPLSEEIPGSWTSRMTFQGEPYGGAFNVKYGQTKVAKGEIKTLELYQSWKSAALFDGYIGRSCNKLDYNNVVFRGLAGTPTLRPMFNNNELLTLPNNPNLNTGIRGSGDPYVDLPTQNVIIQYSNEPHATLQEQRDDRCQDDVNADGKVVIDGLNTATGNADGPNDWVSDVALLPNGEESVTKVRFDTVHDQATYEAAYSGATEANYQVVFNIEIKSTAVGYGPQNYLSHFSNETLLDTSGNVEYTNGGGPSVDPAAQNFSFTTPYDDRLVLVDSTTDLSKTTVPTGLKVVRGGDVVEFELEPRVLGAWVGAQTAYMYDQLPAETVYIPGSETFSVDGGQTFVSHTEYQDNYQNNVPGYTIQLTSAQNTGTNNIIDYAFANVETGEQLPLVRYKVQVDEALTSGVFVNRVYLEAPNIAADQDTIDTDNDGVADSSDGVADVLLRRYSLTIVPEAGFEVLKTVAPEVYATNQPFDYRLIYKNLGAEDYTQGDFIDVLPYNGDGAVGLGGFATGRTPATDYTGVYALQTIASGEGEQFLVTDADPTTIAVDPCATSNLPAGYVPADGELCYQPYVNNGNTLPDGQATGTGTTAWVTCTSSNLITVDTDCPLDPVAITGIRFTVANIATTGGKSVVVTLNPLGNRGGEVIYTTNADGQQVVDYTGSPALGDIYTNSFGGRIKEISLEVISNDVTITPVTGTLGDTVWSDFNNNGLQDNGEPGTPGVPVAILTAAGDPLYRDTTTGAVVYGPNRTTYETATGRTLQPYTTTTDGTGQYEFDQLPAGNYRVAITPPSPRISQSYDLDDGITPVGTSVPTTPFITDVTLTPDINFVTGNILGVNSLDTADFGLSDLPDVAVDTTVDSDGDGSFVDFEILDAPGFLGNPDPTPFQFRSVVTNQSSLTTATNVVARSVLPPGVEYVSYSVDGGTSQPIASPTDDFDWSVGTLAPGQSSEIIFTVRLTQANSSAFIAGFNGGSGQFITEVQSMTELDLDSTPDNRADPFDPATSEDDEDDARVTIRPALGNFVWSDTNNNGLQDPGEPGLGGVTVNLYQDDGDGVRQPGTTDGTPLATVQTLPDGSYYFGGLTDGTPYYIEFDHSTAPSNHRPAIQTTGNDPVVDSNGDTITGLTQIVTLTPGQLNDTLDMGYYPLLSLGNLVFEDRNDNGRFDAPDTRLAGVTVELYEDTNGDGVYTPGTDLQSQATGSNGGAGFAVTDAGGNYLFETLTAGAYIVAIPPADLATGGVLAGYSPATGTNGSATGPNEPAPDPDDNVDNDDNGTLGTAGTDTYYASPAIDLAPLTEPTTDGDTDANTNFTLDLGLWRPSSFTSRIWLDTDRDGQDNNAESGLPGATVTLYNSLTRLPVGTATTGRDGEYSFANLAPGDYYLELTTYPAEYELTLFNQGDDATDSDFDPTTSRTATLSLGYAENRTTELGGLVTRLPDVAVTVTIDGNNDGVFQDREDLETPGLLGNPDPTTFQVRTTVTNESATTQATDVVVRNYMPTGLEYPSYFLDTDPTVIARGANSDTDFDWNLATLAPGETRTITFNATLDAADLTDFVNDWTGDSAQFIAEVQAMAELDVDSQVDNRAGPFDPATSQDDEDDARAALRLALGDYVWIDSNNDGRQDNTEPGLAGVTVNLYVDNGDGDRQPGAEDGAPVTTVQTDATGRYSFEDLQPDLPYYIEFDHSTTPASYRPTTATRGGDSESDSDGDETTGLTEIITLTPGQSDLTLDMGYTPLHTLGNLVFEDRDNDGLFEPTDTPLAGVTVQLYEDTDGDGQYTPGVDLQSLEPGSAGGPGFAVTDATGNYLFENLTPGDYLVLIPQSQFADSAVLAGYAPSTGTNASATGPYEPAPSPAGDVDNDDNGTLQDEGYATAALTLTPTDTGEPTTNLTLDLGLFQPASLGSTVWVDTDADGQDESEPGIPGITVTLYDAVTGLPLTSVTTDENGQYLFENLIPGEYFVELGALPPEYSLTRMLIGDPATDSDFDPATRRTRVIVLGYAESNSTVFAGLVSTESPSEDDPVSPGPTALLRTGGEFLVQTVTGNLPLVLIVSGALALAGVGVVRLRSRL